MRRFLFFVPALTIAVALAATGAPAPSSHAQSGASVHIIAIDADPAGNTATSLGPLNACVRTEPGANVTVDLIADAVPGPPDVNGIVGFEISVDYSAALLKVSAYDYEFLLAASGDFEPFEALGDAVPDTDGRLNISVADLAAGTAASPAEVGPGVLARIALSARAAGIATVAPVFDSDHYPTIINAQNDVTDVDSIAGVQIAIGRDCPVPPNSTPVAQPIPSPVPAAATSTLAPGQTPPPGASGTATPATGAPSGAASPRPSGTATAPTGGPGGTGEGDGGASTGVVIAVVALALAGLGLAGAGGLVLYRRAQGG